MPWKPFAILLAVVATLILLLGISQLIFAYNYNKNADTYMSQVSAYTTSGEVQKASSAMMWAQQNQTFADSANKNGIFHIMLSLPFFWGAFYSRKKAKINLVEADAVE
jgi:hypothetical protein